jgi:hypothetical protein
MPLVPSGSGIDFDQLSKSLDGATTVGCFGCDEGGVPPTKPQDLRQGKEF